MLRVEDCSAVRASQGMPPALPSRGHHRCGWVMCVEFEFKPSAFRHGCCAEDIETAWRQWLTDFIEGDHPVKVVRLGFDRVGRLLEVGAHTLDDGDRVIVFHAMPARKRYTDAI